MHYYMKKENWTLILSIVSIAFSTCAILIWLCEYRPVTWTLLDSCFAVLSAGMTLFVASQVYHSFTLVRKIDEKNNDLKAMYEEKCESMMKEYKDMFENVIRSYDHNVTALAKQLVGINNFSLGGYDKALDAFMEALEEANLSREHEVKGVENPTDGIISYIEAIRIYGHPIRLEQNKVDRYRLILASAGTKDAINLIPYIQSMLEPINTATPNDVATNTSSHNNKSPASKP